MRKRNYIIIGILALIASLVIGFLLMLEGLRTMGNPNGSKAPDYPYFITTGPLTVKNLKLPKGTKLTYEEKLFREGQQDQMMNEEKLTVIELPKGKTIDWGGVPVYKIMKFFNPEMRGYSVSPDFVQLPDEKKTRFSEMWQSCDAELGVLVKNPDDWSFDVKNIVDISDCSVLYQRYFRDDVQQQSFLDKLLGEMKKSGHGNIRD
ncbi:hypothetical protein [uncultured Chryseobacterium sp.]|uniref:hypothetical protein n=1 Tax=uncultured Chryseobacterium sp. TaxID=259322 RepID=UPI0025E668D9|nr:hypothetical protein [uncultured Chryseobacterium sp.]